jgi:hypothetical protein
MRVDAHGRVISTPQTGSTRRASSGATFTLPADKSPNASTAPVQGSHATAGMDALLALQAFDLDDEPRQRRRRQAVAQGRNLLDALDGLKIALLSGHVPQEQLARLSQLVETGINEVDDPGLLDVLKEIDLRAQVEMAKFSKR